MSHVQIRRATKTDAETISATLLNSFLEYRVYYTDRGFAATTPPTSEILVRLREGPVWVAVLEGRIVGTVSVVLNPDNSLYVRGMAVLPETRGLQIGAELLTCVEEYGRSRGFGKLVLNTTPFLDRAIRLYERLGFLRTEAGPSDLFGTPLFTMEKLL